MSSTKRKSGGTVPRSPNAPGASESSLDSLSDTTGKKVKGNGSLMASPGLDTQKVTGPTASKDITIQASPGTATGTTNMLQSNTKRNKKAAVKKESQAAKKEHDLEKYKDIPGVTEWFQSQKQSLEQDPSTVKDPGQAKKRAVILSLPLVSHTWKPPRIDGARFQCNELMPKLGEVSAAPGLRAPKEGTDEFKAPKEMLPLKRRHRSLSSDRCLLSKEQESKRDFFLGTESSKEEAKIEENPEVAMEQTKLELMAAHPNSLSSPSSVAQLTFDPKSLGPQSEQSQQFKDYLELVDFLMSETLSSCNGVWLKGSSVGYQEKALQLLHKYSYNYDLAKFHMLFPSVMAIPERKQEILHSLTPKELETIVEDAIIDLRGCKTKEAEEACKTIIHAVKNRITLDDLAYYQQVLKKLRVDTPAEVERELARSREFSKLIKKRTGTYTPGTAQQVSNDKKMKMHELLELQREASEEYFVVTPEMLSLNDQVLKAEAWQAKAELMSKQVVQLKTLQNFLLEARPIPVNFDQIYESTKKRAADGVALVERIYNTFTKVTKTRTQLQQDSFSGNKATNLPENGDSKETLFRSLLSEADSLLINHLEIKNLRDHLDLVDQWKSRASLFLEDLREQKTHKELFKSFILEGSLFKFEMELSEDLLKRSEFIDWHEKVLHAHFLIYGIAPAISVLESSVPSEEESDSEMASGPLTIDKLSELIAEGQQKQFCQLQLHEIVQLTDLGRRVVEKQEEVREALEMIDSGCDKVPRLSTLVRLKQEIEELKVSFPEVEGLEREIEKAQSMVLKCGEYLAKSQALKEAGDSETNLSLLNEFLDLKDHILELNVGATAFSRFCQLLRPILQWIEHSRSVIKTYHRSLDPQVPFNHLNLLEPHQYKDDDYAVSDDEMEVQQPDDFAKDGSDFELLGSLVDLAEQDFKILTLTKDFEILRELQGKVNLWLERSSALAGEEDSYETFAAIDLIDKLLTEHLPVPPDRVIVLNKRLRRLRWMKRITEITQAEKVKLKTLETLAKDANHQDIQENHECKGHAEKLLEQLQQCRIWSEDYAVTDINSQKDILRLLDTGKSLKLNLDDYVDLKAFHHDMLEWRNTTHALLNGPILPKHNLEFLKSHLDQAAVLDIGDLEQEILTHLVEVCTQWNLVSRKILLTRQLAKLDLPEQIQPPAVLLDEDVEMKESYEEAKPSEAEKYCICRRPDDGMHFMIECDTCNEWFHGFCVGLTEEESLQYSSYMCIGCARVKHGFDPLNPQAIYDQEDPEKLILNPEQLKAFSLAKRVDLEFFEKVLSEAQSIPAFLEDLQPLSNFSQQYKQWVPRVDSLLKEPLDALLPTGQGYISHIEEGSSSSDSSSDQIINTKTNQAGIEGGSGQAADEVTRELHRCYLESESFPFEVPSEIAETIKRRLQGRQWYSETGKLLEAMALGEISNNAKAQTKKQMRRLVTRFQELKGEYDNSLEDVHFLHMRHQAQQVEEALATQQNQKYQYKKFRYQEEKKKCEEDEEEGLQEVVIELDEQHDE